MAFSFHHILDRFTAGSGLPISFSSRRGRPRPLAMIRRLSAPKSSERSNSPKTESQKPMKKSLSVRKEFPETWLWTEEMVK